MEDLSVSILIDNKKIKNKPINIPKRTPSIWIPDKKVVRCFHCNLPFSMLMRRKHHCRVCGRVFCCDCTIFTDKINTFVNTTTPPSYHNNYLHKFNWKGQHRLCQDCYGHSAIADNYQTYIVLFANIPFSIKTLMKLRIISKKWCSSINFILSTFRGVQYKLPEQKITKLEKKFLWNHRYEFNMHYYWIAKCITLNKDICKLEIEKLTEYYIKNNTRQRCKYLLCSSRCKNILYAEHILELCFYADLNDKNIEKLVRFYLSKKIKIFLIYLMPWFIEIMKKNMEIGWQIIIECINDEKLAYHLYFEMKFYLTNIKNNNIKTLFIKFKTHLPEYIRKEISKTDNFIRFLKNVLNTSIEKRKKMVENWFLENEYVKLPWNIKSICIWVDIDNIKILTSQSRPVVVPFILKSKKTIHILIKNEDLRKDKLTMYISKWINIFCTGMLTLKTYNVLCYDIDYGWIEMIPDVKTLYELQYNEGKTLTNYLMDNNPNITVSSLRDNFINTCAGSCVLSYILGVGDRHQENILISKTGELINVDFSYILGADPKHVQCEMKITKEMLDMLGGLKSNNFIKFKNKCINVYKKIRKYSTFWYLLLIYLAFNQPCIDDFYNKYSIIKKHVIERLVPGEFDDESSMQIVEIVDKSSNESYMSRFSDLTHHIANKAKEWGEIFTFSE